MDKERFYLTNEGLNAFYDIEIGSTGYLTDKLSSLDTEILNLVERANPKGKSIEEIVKKYKDYYGKSIDIETLRSKLKEFYEAGWIDIINSSTN